MTLYECLGIDPFLMNETIPADMIIDNIDQAGLRNDARRFFNDITRVSLRASFNRDNHYLQVIEVELNNVMHINEISVLIQKAIRYGRVAQRMKKRFCVVVTSMLFSKPLNWA